MVFPKKKKIKKEFRSFETKEDVRKWVNQYYSEDYQYALRQCYHTDNDPFFLGLYKGSMYKVYNTLLRNPNISIDDLITSITRNALAEEKELFQKSKNMLSNYEKLRSQILKLNLWIKQGRIPTNIIVYRYVCDKEYDDLTIDSGEKTICQFLSTTLLIDKCSKHPYTKKKIIRILLPEGTRGIYLPEVMEQSPEYEILLPHHTKLKLYEEYPKDEIPTFICTGIETEDINTEEFLKMFE